MLIEAGHFALTLALGLSLIQCLIPLWGAKARDPALMSVAVPAALAVAFCLAFAFAALLTAFATSDFSVALVAAHSHSTQPVIYKITGLWGNHEGSMLLWALILALFGALVAISGDRASRLRSLALSVQAAVTIAFLCFILLTSNPFARLDPAPPEGQELNPVLQDLGLALHPPLLYLGYVGFSITFAFAMAALIDGRIDAIWARSVRPWTLAAWCCLTLGIAMGSYWAYYELGWGGWWFWDPVENASLMPWLAGTALLHSLIVMEKREALKVWTILLAILTFSLSLLGTFLVRSGVLTSVHAFAVDPTRGIFILAILVFFIGGSLALFAWRAPSLQQGGLFAPLSREGALVLNNLFLSTACGAVFIGTLYPLALEALTGEKISVGPPYFNFVFIPLFLALLVLMPLGQALPWKRGDLAAMAQRLVFTTGLSFLAALALLAATAGGPVAAPLGIGLGIFLIGGAVQDIALRSKAPTLTASRLRAKGLPRSFWGMATAHAGMGVTVIGIAASAWSLEGIAALKPGDTLRLGSYVVKLEGAFSRKGPNYQEDVARLSVWDGGHDRGIVETAKRVYTAKGSPTTEAGIRTFGLSQLYVTIGETQSDGRIAIRAYDKPFVLLIWIGAVIMACGGGLSLSDRRLRIGAPMKAKLSFRKPADAV